MPAEPAAHREPCRVDRDGAVATLTLDRPPVNALDADGYDSVAGRLRDLDADRGIRSIVLTGAGTKAFSAGTDTRALADPASVDRVCDAALSFFQTLSVVNTPLVGALNGPAVGGGAMIAAECDVLVAVRGVRLGIPELQLGFPGAGSHLLRLVPRPVALRMLLTGEQPDAERLLGWGALADVVDTADQLHTTAQRYATVVAALDPAAAGPARSVLRRDDDAKALDGYRQELDLLRRILTDHPAHMR